MPRRFPLSMASENARSLAKMYAAIIDEVDGVRLLSHDTVERARKPQTDGLPEIEPGPYPLRFALGYELSRTGSPMLGPGSFGHAGAGGRLGFVHPESGIAVGYVCNNMLWDYTRGPDDRWLPRRLAVPTDRSSAQRCSAR